MSETQSKSAAKVAEKITNMREAVAEAGDDLDGKGTAYSNYRLYFQGLSEGMEIAGGGHEAAKPALAAMNFIDRQLDALEAEAALGDLLQQDVEAE